MFAKKNESKSKNKSDAPGREVKVAAWMLNHPLTGIVTPAVIGGGLYEFNPLPCAIAVGSATLAGIGWRRIHPVSYHKHGGRVVRRVQRRWVRYRGVRWSTIMRDCELDKVNRASGEVTIPLVVRVTSPHRDVDVVTVKMRPGQTIGQYMDASDVLAKELGAAKVTVTAVPKEKIPVQAGRGWMVKNNRKFLDITATYEELLTKAVPMPPIPESVRDVNVKKIAFAADTFGTDVTESLIGSRVFCSGASGSGKSSFMWGPLIQLAPLIREGLVRVTMIDLKGGQETSAAKSVFFDYATVPEVEEIEEYQAGMEFDDEDDDEPRTALEVLSDYWARIQERQKVFAAQGIRKFTAPSKEFPLELLIIDELAALTALSGYDVARAADQILSKILTQFRASGGAAWMYLQEPTKDVARIRDLFASFYCLAQPTASFSEAVLGDGSHSRGYRADEIPVSDDGEFAGIGYRKDGRKARYLRGFLVTDNDIRDFVRAATPVVEDVEEVESNVIELRRLDEAA
jgi:S-DNA-T family DNA segregation ATPase FtsK/SpoIIIE